MSAAAQAAPPLPGRWGELVDLGFSVIPVEHRGKLPLGKWRPFQTMRAPAETVAQWASRETNIGIVTGNVSGLLVLDLDSAEAVAEAGRRGLPDTVTVSTAKGLHVYFRHPGGTIGNRAGIFPGADIRGDGGYVVAPGSVHPSGAEYCWHNPPGLFDLAPPPAWLLDLLAKPEPKLSAEPARIRSAYGERAIDSELAALRRASEGERNDALNRAAFSLAQLAAGGEIAEESTKAHLRATAAAIGLDAAEIDPTLASGWNAGFEQPRRAEVKRPPLRQGQSRHLRPDYDPETGEYVEPDFSPLPGEAGPEQWEGTFAPPRRFIWKDWIVRGAAGLLGGEDGVGKSLLAQQQATCAAAGRPFMGLPIERCRALYITCEDPQDELQRRQEDINRALGITMADLRGWLKTHSLKGEIGNELGTFDNEGRLRTTPRYEQVRRAALDFGAELVFIDNAAHVFPGNENARHDVAAFLGLLERLSIEIDGAVILLAHPNKQHSQGNKQGNEYSGTTGWSAHVRNRMFLDWNAPADGLPADPDERVLRRSKANYAARGAEIVFRWHQWAFMLNDDLPADYAADLTQTIKASAENQRFLDCLAACTARRRAVSHNPGTNYAPKIFASMIEGRGIGAKAFAAAMERLLHLGQIELDVPLWQGENRHWKQGIRLVEKCANPPAPTPCAEARQPLAENGGNPCADLRANLSPSTTYIRGAAHEPAAPDEKGGAHA